MRQICHYLITSIHPESRRAVALIFILMPVLLADPKAAFAQYTSIRSVVAPTLTNRLDIGGMYSRLTNQSYANGLGSLRWTRQVGSEWAMFGESTFEEHFRVNDTRLTVGAIRKFGFANTLWGSYSKSPDAELIATRQFDVGGAFFLSAKVPSQLFHYENRRYTENVTLDLFTSTTTFSLTPRVATSATYVLAAVSGVYTNSGLLTVTLVPTSSLALTFGGGYGSEHYAARTRLGVERGSDIATLRGTATLTLSSTTGVSVTYVHLNRMDESPLRSYHTHEVVTNFHVEF